MGPSADGVLFIARHALRRPGADHEAARFNAAGRSRSIHLAHSGGEPHQRKDDCANEAQDHDFEMRGAACGVHGVAHRTPREVRFAA
jgi:hypothetical protein